MRLPFLTARLLHSMTRGHFTQGLHELPHTRVFVTSGLSAQAAAAFGRLRQGANQVSPCRPWPHKGP
jgi:hypothetical protein